MTTVLFDVVYPDGSPRAHGRVQVVLGSGGAGASTGSEVIVGTTTVHLDAAGHAEVPLPANVLLDPEGTFYRCTVIGAVPPEVREIRVPDQVDPVSWADPEIQVHSPAAPAVVPSLAALSARVAEAQAAAEAAEGRAGEAEESAVEAALSAVAAGASVDDAAAQVVAAAAQVALAEGHADAAGVSADEASSSMVTAAQAASAAGDARDDAQAAASSATTSAAAAQASADALSLATLVTVAGGSATALVLDRYHVVTTDQAMTITDPAAPTDGRVHWVAIEFRNAGSHAVTLPGWDWDLGTVPSWAGVAVVLVRYRAGVTPLTFLAAEQVS